MNRSNAILSDDLRNKLEFNFLYNNDVNSLYLLLSILQESNNYKNFKPRYICTKNVIRSLIRFLKNRSDKYYIANSIYQLINDDINRIELLFLIQGYSAGYNDNKLSYKIERHILKVNPTVSSPSLLKLIDTSFKSRNVNLKRSLFASIDHDKNLAKSLKQVVRLYFEKHIKQQVETGCLSSARQLMFDLDAIPLIIKNNPHITKSQVNSIYNKLQFYTYRNLLKVYKESYWKGATDSVNNRYRA